MKIFKEKEILKHTVATGQYVEFPSFAINGRDLALVMRLNDDVTKELLSMLNKLGTGYHIDDISGQHLKFRVKDTWFPFYMFSTVERLFMVAYAAGCFKKNVVFRYGFNQMKPKTLRTFINTFKDNDYVSIIAEDAQYRQLKEMLQDQKVLYNWTYQDVGEREDLNAKLQELGKESLVDNLRPSQIFFDVPFVATRMNIVKNVTWSTAVYDQGDGYLVYNNPLNNFSYKLRSLFDLMCRQCDYLLLKEPDAMLDVCEQRMLFEYLSRAADTYKGIYLSKYI